VYVTAAERETQRTVQPSQLQIGIMADVAKYWTIELRIAGAYRRSVLRVLHEQLYTAFSEAKVLRPKLTLIKRRFVSGPHCSVILLLSPSRSSQTPQEEFEMASGTSRTNIRGQISVHMESIRRETNKDLILTGG